MTDNLYLNMIHRLKNMSEDQMLELMFDLDNEACAERLLEAANHYIDRESCEECCEKRLGKSDYQDWRQADDEQRYRDIKSTQDSMK